LSISLSTPENYLTKKNELTKLLVKVKNHSENKNHLFIVVEGNSMVLRVGEKEKAVFVGAKE
jgi:Leucine-rich repeat (LRR) protein